MLDNRESLKMFQRGSEFLAPHEQWYVHRPRYVLGSASTHGAVGVVSAAGDAGR